MPGAMVIAEGIGMMTAGLKGMGLLSGSGSQTTTTNSSTSSWLADQLEPIVTNFIGGNPTIDYENSTIAGMTPAQQAALNAYGGGASITTGQNIAKGGAGLVEQSISQIQGLLSGGAVSQMKTGVSGIYNSMSDFISGQDSAIQDSVYSQMGQQFGQSAQSNMASTSVSGSSAAQNATNSILASGANSMVQQMSDVSSSVLAGAVDMTGNALSGEMSLIDTLMREGGDIFGTGSKIVASGAANQFKAGTFEQWFNQQNANNNRKNDMINNNMEWLDMGALLDVVLPAAGIDTKTNSTSSGSTSGGGLF